MHKVFPALVDPERCGTLLSLAQKHLSSFIKSEGVMRRMGINGSQVMSEYAFLKYWKMPDAVKILVDDALPSNIRKQANEVWLLHFPEGGQLDQYQSSKALFNCLSIPLNSGGVFNVWDGKTPQSIVNKAGDGVLFSLANSHGVPVTMQADWYLCFLFLNHLPETIFNESNLKEVTDHA
jgi:hypothetical protein